MKKLSKKLLSVLLVIAMLVPTGALMVTTGAAGSYITGLATSHRGYRGVETAQEDMMITKAYLHDAQYSIIDFDLNKGAYGDYIYAGYKTGTNISDAIRGLKVYKGSSPPSSINSTINGASCTFYPVSDVAGGVCNLNSNTDRGTSIFLYYTKDVAAGNPIGNISIGTSRSDNSVTYFDSTSAADLNVGAGGEYIYICYTTLNTPGSDVSGPQFPAGYNFYEDSYNFDNGKTTISKKYFTTIFGEEQGKLLYKKKKNASGVCFGMAYTTAAFYQGLPSLSVNVRDMGIKTTIRIGNNYMSVYDYIIYSYIYQFSSSEWEIIRAKNSQQYVPDLYNIVKNNLKNDVLVPITMWYLKKNTKNEWHVNSGHAVLAVGIEGNKILVDDPNNENEYKYIEIRGDGSWYFSGLSWESEISSNEACFITYSLNVHKPYQMLASGTHTTVHNDVLGKNISADMSSETYVEGMDKLDTDKLLMFVDSESHKIDSENLIEITDTIGTDESESEDIGNLYWVSEDKTVTVSDITGEDNEIIVAGNEVSIGVKTQDNSVVTMTVDEENDDISAEIDSTVGNEYTITFESTDENENDLITTLTGTANGDEVVASETEGGIQVIGLNDIIVTYETADGTAETKAEVKDGSTVNITVNDDENKVETDWQDKDETDEECKHPDTNHDGICDNCGKDFTADCGHSCHSDNLFVQFFYKIARFFWKLFGMNQYQYCGCGKAHW